MKEIFDKLTSYNLFNYLLPGVIFVFFVDKFTTYSFKEDNLIIASFLYYFIGMVISRFGSLIVEPVLKKISFLKFTDYREFVSASKNNAQIEILSEVNNTYRTLSSTFIILLLLKLMEIVESKLPMLQVWNLYVVIVLLLMIFLFSYKKQTQYIRKRNEINKK